MTRPRDPPQRRPGRPRAPLSRDQLREAACTTFAEAGYAGATMSSIAARAGIRKASLFHHFRSKQVLYLETLSEIAEDLVEMVRTADLGSGSFLERLERLGCLIVWYLGTHPRTARLAMREMVDGGPFCADLGRPHVDHALQAVSDFLAAGMTEGAIPNQDPRQLAVSIIGLHLFHFAAAEVTGGLLDGDVFRGAAVDERCEAVIAQVRQLCGSSRLR